MLRCAENDTTSSFQQFKGKICVQKEVLQSFTGVSLSIGDCRILRLLCIILQLYFKEVWLFFIPMNQTWMRYVKRNYSQKCVIL